MYNMPAASSPASTLLPFGPYYASTETDVSYAWYSESSKTSGCACPPLATSRPPPEPPRPPCEPRRPPHVPQKYLALSTQYVQVHVGIAVLPMLARVSVCDYRGNCVLDRLVLPSYPVADYRTSITGIKPGDLHIETALDLSTVQAEVGKLIKGRIIAGHSLWRHLALLCARHPAIDTRDVALFLPFHRTVRAITHGRGVIPLELLVSQLMRRKIRLEYEHPLEEARAALDLFRSYEDPWEDVIRAGGWPSALPPSAYSDCFS